MVNLTRIYTRTGDGGETRLGDMSVTSKTDLRLEAYADVDEANAHLGRRARARRARRRRGDGADPRAERPLRRRRRLLHPDRRRTRSTRRCAIEQEYVDRLEGWCDQYNEDLPALRSFILNGGTLGGAHLHVARTVVRRAERSAWAAWSEHGETMNVLAITYLNRLSDLLFILARHANQESGDVLWVPGGERNSTKGSEA